MYNSINIRRAIGGILMLMFYSSLFSQIIYTTESSKSKMIVKGTSNLHDWEEQVEKINCKCDIKIENNQLKTINNVTFSCLSKDIVSGNSIMDSKTQTALKSEKYSDIWFHSNFTSAPLQTGNLFEGKMPGSIFIAGVTRNMEIIYKVKITDPSHLIIYGNAKIDMTLFNVVPPTALFGTLTTGKDVVIEFEISLSKN